MPQWRLPCDQNSGEVHREVFDPSFKEKLNAPVNESGLVVNAPFISISSNKINYGFYQSSGVVSNSNSPGGNSTRVKEGNPR